MKRSQYNKIVRPAYLLHLLLAISCIAYAQTKEGEYERGHIWHEKVDTVYVYPGEHTRMFIQTKANGGIYGFSRWIGLGDEAKDENWYKTHFTWLPRNPGGFKYDEKLNCYIANDKSTPASQPHYRYVEYIADDGQTTDNSGIIDSLAWDGSAWNDWQWENGQNYINQLPTAINIRRKFIIKDAKARYAQLKEAQEAYQKSAETKGDNDALVEDGYFEKYEVHTPLRTEKNHGSKDWETGVNFRLKESLANYYVKDYSSESQDSIHYHCAKYVRWRVFDENKKAVDYCDIRDGSTNKDVPTGGYVVEHEFPTLGCKYSEYTGKGTDEPGKNTSIITNAAVFYCMNLHGPITKQTARESLTRYITADVSADKENWFPVALITVKLEPYSDPRTAGELEQAKDYNYRKRSQDLLDEDVSYDLIAEINFDDPEVDGNKVVKDPKENYRPTRLNKESSEYAFADLSAYDQNLRTPKSRTLSRSEYVLYKTLNVAGISRVGKEGYNDYFCKDGSYYVKAYDRLYERLVLKGESTPGKMGYFLYLDAIDEPGRIVSLPVENQLCKGTRLLVTAWVCNMEAKTSNSIAGDIGFTFKGFTSDGEVKDLYKFYTGSMRHTPAKATDRELPLRLEWQQVCFEFTIPDNIDYESYRLELANNCQHSDGADYAVDEIRVYRSTPNINVRRKAACDASSVLLRSDYEMLLYNLGVTKDEPVWGDDAGLGDEYKKQYILLRLGLSGLDDDTDDQKKSDYFKNLYFSFLEDFHVTPVTRNVDDGTHKWLELDYNGNGHLGRFGRVIVSTKEEYIPASQEDAKEMAAKLNLEALKEYRENYSALKQLAEQNIIDLHEAKGPGSYTANDLETAYQLFADLGLAPISCAWKVSTEGNDADTGYIFLADIKTAREGQDTDGGDKLVPGTEYYAMLINGSQQDVSDGSNADPHSPCALIAPFSVLPPLRLVINGESDYTQSGYCFNNPVHIDATLQASKPDGGVIHFEPENYCFDWYFFHEDEASGDNDTDGEGNDKGDAETGNGNLWPDEVVLLFADLKLFREDLNKDVSGEPKKGNVEDLKAWNPGSDDLELIKKKLIGLVEEGSLLLSVHSPEFTLTEENRIFYVLPFTVDEQELKEEIESVTGSSNALLCLEPQKVELEATTKAPVMKLGLTDIQYPEDMSEVPLRIGLEQIKECRRDESSFSKASLQIPVRHIELTDNSNADHLGISSVDLKDSVLLYKINGDVVEELPIVAVLTDMKAEKNGSDNYIRLNFLPDFEPLEGYIYTLMIHFEERTIDNKRIETCDGIVYLPLKIVPQYLTWISDGTSRNWNNDALWRRSNKKELYMGSEEDADANPDGLNRNDLEYAFAPMNFSYVTILKPENSSWLYKLTAKGSSDQSLNMIPEDNPDRIGDATDRIEYDMMTPEEVDDGVYAAVAFNGNRCNEIYFKPGATLMRQDYLTYKKARVEFEMVKNQKYFLSSPLQGVIAGDMYAPKETGRQETEAFKDITFVKNQNNRFNPAFYQKTWDNSAKMYLKNENDKVYEAVASNWSIEYNDVSVPYESGIGFYGSVENLKNGTALVRLPKADTFYDYYDTGGQTDTNDQHKIPSEQSLRGRLGFDTGVAELEAEVINATNGYFFFVGNPFMTYLNMEKFFDGNGELTRTYWTEYDAFVLDKGNETVSTNGSTGGFLKPMQGFFVRKQDAVEAKSLTVTFTPEMMSADNNTSLSTRSSEGETFPTLYISAKRNDECSSISIVKREQADTDYRIGEDAAVLLDTDEKQHPALYSVAGNQAVAINQTSAITNIPLGIYSDNAEDVTLTFEGIEQFDSPLYLYDALLDQSIRLDALNTQVTVPGSTHGRYYLNSGKEGLQAESDIAIYSPVAGEIVVATSSSDRLKTVRVYDLSGRLQLSLQSINEPVKRLYLTGGVYVVKVSTEKGDVKSSKVIVK